MRAASTKPPNEEAILILVSYGANPNIKTELGESLNSFEFSQGFSAKLSGMNFSPSPVFQDSNIKLAAKQYWINSSVRQTSTQSGQSSTPKNVTNYGTVGLSKSGFVLSPRRGSILTTPVNSNNNTMTEDDILRLTSRTRSNLNLNPDDLKLRRSTAQPSKTTAFNTLTPQSNKTQPAPHISKQENYNRMRSTSSVPTYTANSVPNSPVSKSTYTMVNEKKGTEKTVTPNILEATKKKKASKKDKQKKKDKSKKEEKLREKEEKQREKEEKNREKKDEKKEQKSKTKSKESKSKEEKSKKKSKKKLKSEPKKEAFEVRLQPIYEENALQEVVEESEEDEYYEETVSHTKEGSYTEAQSNTYPSSTPRSMDEEIEPVNIDAITEVLCKFVKEAVHRNLGNKFSDFGPLFQATKEISTTFKQTHDIAERFATTLDEDHSERLLSINHTMKTELVADLYEAIKAINQIPPNLVPLKSVVQKLTNLVHELYVCLESVEFSDVMASLQSTVLKMKQFVTAAKMLTEETFQYSSSSLVVTSMELCSFIHDYVFIDARSKTNKRLMNESCFNTIQSIRSLIISIKNVNSSPNNEDYSRNMTVVLKTTAEHIRTMSKCLKDEDTLRQQAELVDQIDKDFKPMEFGDVESLFIKAIGLIANARSKYTSKSNNILSAEEKSLMDIVLSQSQLLKHIVSSLSQEKFELLMGAVLLTSENVTKMSEIILPISDSCMNPLLVQEIAQCLENSIRCAIQLKIISASISVNPRSPELQEHIGYTVLMWGGFLSFLLDAVWRATHNG